MFIVLLVGRLFCGVATSLLYSAFESWLVAEHFKVCLLAHRRHSGRIFAVRALNEYLKMWPTTGGSMNNCTWRGFVVPLP